MMLHAEDCAYAYARIAMIGVYRHADAKSIGACVLYTLHGVAVRLTATMAPAIKRSTTPSAHAAAAVAVTRVWNSSLFGPPTLHATNPAVPATRPREPVQTSQRR